MLFIGMSVPEGDTALDAFGLHKHIDQRVGEVDVLQVPLHVREVNERVDGQRQLGSIAVPGKRCNARARNNQSTKMLQQNTIRKFK